MHVVSVASDLFDFSLHFISFLIISLITLLFLLPDTFTFLNVVDKYPAYFRWGLWHPGREQLFHTHTTRRGSKQSVSPRRQTCPDVARLRLLTMTFTPILSHGVLLEGETRESYMDHLRNFWVFPWSVSTWQRDWQAQSSWLFSTVPPEFPSWRWFKSSSTTFNSHQSRRERRCQWYISSRYFVQALRTWRSQAIVGCSKCLLWLRDCCRKEVETHQTSSSGTRQLSSHRCAKWS